MSKVLVLGINIPSMYMPNLDKNGLNFNSDEIFKNFRNALEVYKADLEKVQKVKLIVNTVPYVFTRTKKEYIPSNKDRIRLASLCEKFMSHMKETFKNIYYVEYSKTCLYNVQNSDLLLNLDSDMYKVFFYISPELTKENVNIENTFKVEDGRTDVFSQNTKSNPVSI